MGKSGYSTLIWNNVDVAAIRLQQISKHGVMIKHFTDIQKLFHRQVAHNPWLGLILATLLSKSHPSHYSLFPLKIKNLAQSTLFKHKQEKQHRKSFQGWKHQQAFKIDSVL